MSFYHLNTTFSVSLLALILAACGSPLSTTSEPVSLESPTPEEQFAETPAQDEPELQSGDLADLYQNDTFKISLRYPAGWEHLEGEPESGERIGGPDGFFSIGARSSGGLGLDELARTEAEQSTHPFGSNPMIEAFEVQGRDARLVFPSDDQPKPLPDEPAWGMLIAPYPRPVLVGKTLADTFTLYADLDHLSSIAGSLTFEEQPALFPPDSETPAAGICDLASENPVKIVLSPDMPDPRCMKLLPEHRLSLTNRTGIAQVVRLAWYKIPLEVEETLLLDVPVGSYLAPNVHYLAPQQGGNAPALLVLP